MSIPESPTEANVRALMGPTHALIYVLVALLGKLQEEKIFSREDVKGMFDDLEGVVIEFQEDPLETQEAEITLAIIQRFRRILSLEQSDT